MKYCKISFIPLCLLLIVGGCGAIDELKIEPVTDIKAKNLDGSSKLDNPNFGSNSLFSFSTDPKREVSAERFPFNLYLWQSAVRVAAAAGIRDISPESGVIVSEWFGDDESSFETQMTITISGAALTSTGVRVDTVRRNKTGNQKSFPGSNVVSAKLKDAILIGARELRRNVGGN